MVVFFDKPSSKAGDRWSIEVVIYFFFQQLGRDFRGRDFRRRDFRGRNFVTQIKRKLKRKRKRKRKRGNLRGGREAPTRRLLPPFRFRFRFRFNLRLI